MATSQSEEEVGERELHRGGIGVQGVLYLHERREVEIGGDRAGCRQKRQNDQQASTELVTRLVSGVHGSLSPPAGPPT